ncbi:MULTISPECIES: DUF5715 family protein [Acidobacteriaceae]|uniref:DUF5715 family protein n=1 Tax=Acidobacteriaceae TaxID=204434 RepID=UPI00131DE2D6|nr:MULTISPECIES: DUF5715 family protein [Acidobacteriaceae]MDW5264819.1 DUF5715 family protein [Edaphobacter sp.]
MNATLPAFLALAVLFLIPATLLAKPVHHRARKSAAVHQQAHRKATAARRHTAEPRVAPVRSSHTRTRRHQAEPVRTGRAKARRSTPRRLSVSDNGPRKATSDDFLKAASVKQDVQQAPAPHRTERAAVVTHSRRSSRRSRSVARPVSVVNVIRPTAEKPQLKSIADEAVTPAILPMLYNKRGRLIIPPPLKGSHEILIRQNEVADREGLDRIQNDADLMDMRGKRMLVPLPTSYALQVDDRLPENRRYTRPWTAVFLASMARAHYAHFHTPLQINSAVRTVEFQQHLIRINGNAAPAEGDTASPHLTGQAIDIAKHGLSRTEVAWMRGYLLPLIQEGKIDVEEEFQQSCFHISVYKRYLPPADAPTRDLAYHRRGEASTLAAAIR